MAVAAAAAASAAAAVVAASSAAAAVAAVGGVRVPLTVVAATASVVAAAVVAVAAVGATVWRQSLAVVMRPHYWTDGGADGGPVPCPDHDPVPPTDSPPGRVAQMCWCWPSDGEADGGATAAVGGAAGGPDAPCPSSNQASSRARKTKPVRRLFLAAPGQSEWRL